MCGVVGALAASYHDSLDINNDTHREIAAYRLLSKMPTLAAMCYKYSVGQPFIYPRNDLSYAENFLHMMFATPCEEYEVNPIVARAMDKISLYMRIMNKTHRHRLYVWQVHRVLTHLRVSQQVSLLFGPCTWWRKRSLSTYA